MNKRGQTLILFVLLVPIILTCLAIVVDVGILTYQYQRTRGILDQGITLALEKNDLEEVKKNLLLNDIPVNSLKVSYENFKLEVFLDYKIDSLFGKLINLVEYEIRLQREGFLKDGKVIITKKE